MVTTNSCGQYENCYSKGAKLAFLHITDADEKIAFALATILFTPFIAIVVSAVWGALLLPGQSFIKYLVYAVACLLIMPGLITAFNRRLKLIIVCCGVFALCCIFTVLLDPSIEIDVLFGTMFRFIGMGALGLGLAGAIENCEKLWNILVHMSYLVTALGIIYFLTALSSSGVYSMSFANAMFIPAIILLMRFFNCYKWYDLLIALAICWMVFLRGSRGALACVALSVVILFFYWWIVKAMQAPKKRWLYIVIIIAVIAGGILIATNISSIMESIGGLLKKAGVTGRTLELFSRGDAFGLSGRDQIAKILFSKIQENPLMPHGIYGSGAIVASVQNIGMEGRYAHNIVLELVCTFGVIGGIAVFALIVGSIVSALIKAKEWYEKNLMIVFLSAGLAFLFISGLVWTYMPFWILMGISIAITKKRKPATGIQREES